MAVAREAHGEQDAAPGESLEEVIDLARYPILSPESPGYRRLIETARRRLAETGACVFEGFMLPGAVARTLAQVAPLAREAFVCSQPHNVYLTDTDPAFPSDHARNRLVRSVKGVLADDEIPAESPLRVIYGAPLFRAFLCEALEIERLFPFADRLASINVNFYGENQELGWHFDNAKFAVTLMLRQADAGGAFEFAPNIREESDKGFARVARI